MLDYWVTSGLITPSHTYRGPNEKRVFFLFSYSELVQIRIVRSLRATGLSLQKIRAALDVLRKRRGSSDDWQKAWLVTDGKNAFLADDATHMETLTGASSGQLAFAVVPMAKTDRYVALKLKKTGSQQFSIGARKGKVAEYDSSASLGRRVNR